MPDQLRFWPKAPPGPKIQGLKYVPDFIMALEEQTLLAAIDAHPWSHEYARRRQHYGQAYSKDYAGDTPSPMPAWASAIGDRIVAAGLFLESPLHALVNEYRPGEGIAAHRDYAPFDRVASLSLGSGCLMEFSRVRDRTRQELWLAPRSLLVLTEEARHAWTHAIRPRLKDTIDGVAIPRGRRVSLTFRTTASAGE